MGKLLLSVETATPICSVVLTDGNTYAERHSDVRGAHAELMPVFIKELLEHRAVGMGDLDGVVLSAGPGSYTGLRIGASIVKGLMFGRTLPLYAVNTLAALAKGAAIDGDCVVHAVIDARRTHLYHQEFRVVDGVLIAVGVPSAKELAEINALVQPGAVVAGTGWNRLDPAVMAGVATAGLESVSAKNVDALCRELMCEGMVYDETIIRHAQVEIFEPDYRGNPYQ
jgi:tRNA threonylcarbamoyl adenosine modification protein YeaZ